MAESMFDRRVAQAIGTLVSSEIVPSAHVPAINRALGHIRRWLHGWLVEAAVLGLALAFIWCGVRSDLPEGMLTWRNTEDRGTTLAGWWYLAISLLVFQFLFWRWGARLLIWWTLLWRIARLPST